MKLTEEDKINIYYERKEGASWAMLSQKYNVRVGNLHYYIDLIERHGINIVKKKRNKVYSKEFKLDCMNRVLIIGESSYSVSLEVGLPNMGTLSNWIRSYKENGYNIIERKRGIQS
ncbi:transposase, partial [Breznakia sp. PF5-3]|uniref:transposase n=1 Tax=unclassified Breznakia TaxID=2623764 RepID=UPI0024058AA6